MAVGGRWGRVEEEESSSVGEGDEKDGEAEVVELSEVRAESDPWQDWFKTFVMWIFDTRGVSF